MCKKLKTTQNIQTSYTYTNKNYNTLCFYIKQSLLCPSIITAKHISLHSNILNQLSLKFKTTFPHFVLISVGATSHFFLLSVYLNFLSYNQGGRFFMLLIIITKRYFQISLFIHISI